VKNKPFDPERSSKIDDKAVGGQLSAISKQKELNDG
jgi:hypothetical protein